MDVFDGGGGIPESFKLGTKHLAFVIGVRRLHEAELTTRRDSQPFGGEALAK